jgi:HK97 family phage major capsid protein
MGTTNIAELKRKKAELLARSREIHEAAAKEKRALSQEESNNFETIVAEARTIAEEVNREEALQGLESSESRGFATLGDGVQSSQVAGSATTRESAEYMSAWRRYLVEGRDGLNPMEARALSSVDASGGFMMTPTEVTDQLIVAINNMVYIRGLATKLTMSPGAKSLGVPTIATDIEDATPTAETVGADEDTALAFGRRELTPFPYTKYIKVSNRLLRGVPKVEQVIIDRMAYKFAVTLEKEYMTGDGTDNALGVFVASNDGIPTGSDVTGATGTAVTVDDCLKVKYALPQQYWRRAGWMMHADIAFRLASQREGAGTGQYLWRESVRAGEPDTFLGRPVYMSAYAPNTITAGQYTAVLGDFSFYHIVDSLGFTVKRLDELYAINDQTGFIGRLETDGAPVLGDAFRRLKQGT